ncbi:hypothetical protein [Oceanobacillus salinisoli]|uniref:hypothetical protein n=1 Tax=Oceanobacillus salinisoli TaxID=2678611 RepID=UPI0012E20D58|nr:hypothetical protein [Oceanobacillus salinisoli]
MKVKKSEDGARVMIGEHKIDGIIREYTCKNCESKIVFFEIYDSEFCPQCNEWTESTCNDPDCFHCVNRPKKPLDNIELTKLFPLP